jgi:hypothetical protein
MSNRTDFENVAKEFLEYEVTCSPAQRAVLAPRLATELQNAFVAGQEAEIRERCAERLKGIGQAVDMTHPDYCPTCDGACVSAH